MSAIMCFTCAGSCGRWWVSFAVFSALTEQRRNSGGPAVAHTRGESACRPGSVTSLPVTCAHSPAMPSKLLFHLSWLLTSSPVFSLSGGTETELAGPGAANRSVARLGFAMLAAMLTPDDSFLAAVVVDHHVSQLYREPIVVAAMSAWTPGTTSLIVLRAYPWSIRIR